MGVREEKRKIMFEITPSSKCCTEQRIRKILASLVIDFTYLLKELDWRIYSAWFCTQLYLHWQRNWSNNCKKHQCHFFLTLPLLKNRDRDHFLAYGAEQSDQIISNLNLGSVFKFLTNDISSKIF